MFFVAFLKGRGIIYAIEVLQGKPSPSAALHGMLYSWLRKNTITSKHFYLWYNNTIIRIWRTLYVSSCNRWNIRQKNGTEQSPFRCGFSPILSCAYLLDASCNSFLACVNITVSAAGMSRYIRSTPTSVFGV